MHSRDSAQRGPNHFCMQHRIGLSGTIEKGSVETAANGFLAGYPMVDFKVTVYDGSYHDVDS